MIDGLRPYPAMKNSGVPWLGAVPEHWGVKRNKLFLREVDERSEDGSEELLTVSQYTGVTRRRERLSEEGELLTNSASLVGHKRVDPGDLVMNIMLAWNGSLGVSPIEGIVSPAYCVFRVERDVEPRFLHFLLRTPIFTGAFKTESTGVVDSRLRLYPVVFFRLPSLVPPRHEQSAIVRFLDYTDRRIRRYIRIKQRLIKLLEEQKEAIIHRAVTRGFIEHLPLNVLGLPQQIAPFGGWKSLSVGHLIQKGWLTIQDGNHGELHPAASEYVDQGIPFLMAKDVRPEGLNFTDCAKITEERARQLRIGFAVPGDALLTHKASIGQIGRVPQQLAWPFVMLTPQVTYYRISTSQITGTYLFLYMQSRAFQEQLKVLSLNQSTRPYIGLIEQRNLVISFPSVERQGEIITAYEADVRFVDGAIEDNRKQIYLFREYRTRLTADVVTGKVDVRAAAANLPEEADEVEATNESDALAESVDDTAEADLEAAPEEAEA